MGLMYDAADAFTAVTGLSNCWLRYFAM